MRPVRAARRLVAARAGVMVFTTSQLFLGAITLGIALFRGTESHLGFHQEELQGLANYAASTLGAEHARAASSVADDNAIAAAIMGPRFAVEADNITMDESAQIACPQHHNAHMQMVCARYHASKPRARAKLAWARAEQQMVWSALSSLSGELEAVAGARAAGVASSGVARLDPAATVRIEDPTQSTPTWGAANGAVACMLARGDTLASPMPGSAFPLLMPNLLGGLPKALVAELPRGICGAGGDAGPALTLPDVPSVSKQTTKDCAALAAEMRCELQGGCDVLRPRGTVLEAPELSKEIAPYAKCEPARSPGSAPEPDAYVVRTGGTTMSCVFDQTLCAEERLAVNSKSYLDGLGLPAIPHAPALDASTRAPSARDWNHSSLFQVCALATKPVNAAIVGISDAVRTIASFGAATPGAAMREAHEYRACARWYFPDGEGPYVDVPHDSQPFVSAWRFALTSPSAPGAAR